MAEGCSRHRLGILDGRRCGERMGARRRKTARFSDLHQAAWAEAAVEQLAALHVIGGYPDGTFQPNKPVTRAEAVALAK